MAALPNGDVVMVGSSHAGSTWYDQAAVVLRPGTGLRWAARFSGSYDRSEDFGRAVAVSPDGSRVFVAGIQSDDGFDGFWSIVAYDGSSGAEVWRTFYAGTGGGRDLPRAIAVSPDGARVYVTGTIESDISFDAGDHATIALDAVTGTRLWTRSTSKPGYDEGRDIAVSPDGERVYVLGTGELLALRVDEGTPGSGGSIAWRVNLAAPNSFGRDMVLSPPGDVLVVTGSRRVGQYYDGYTVAVDALDGSPRWQHGFAGPGPYADQGVAVAVRDGAVYVAARLNAAGSDVYTGMPTDILTLRLDLSSGVEAWRASWDLLSCDEPVGLLVSAGRVYVTGTSRHDMACDYQRNLNMRGALSVLALDAGSGGHAWMSRFVHREDGPVIDQPVGVVAVRGGIAVGASFAQGEVGGWYTPTFGLASYAP